MSDESPPGAPDPVNVAPDPVYVAPDPVNGAIIRTATICNRRGLHARAAAKFVKLAGQFDARIVVIHRGTAVSGRSIMGLMMLAAAPGCTIELRGEGTVAAAAVDALVGLIEAKFDED